VWTPAPVTTRRSRALRGERGLHTVAGPVQLRVPKLRKLPFETEIIRRYQRRETSVEEALIEMYLAGVSVRRVEDITQALWGTRVSSSTVSDLNKKIYGKIEEWRNRPVKGEYPYVYLDGLYLKRSWGGEVRPVEILVAIGVNSEGFREILGVAEGAREDEESWTAFLRHLKKRGLKGVRLVTSDKCLGLVNVVGKEQQESGRQEPNPQQQHVRQGTLSQVHIHRPTSFPLVSASYRYYAPMSWQKRPTRPTTRPLPSAASRGFSLPSVSRA